MSEQPIESIRETNRSVLVLNRKKNRDDEADNKRSMEERINPDTVQNIANKLKTKSSVSVPELQVLKNALIDDVNNINVVLNTHGALRGLVRELTGHEVNKQCAAAGCCCNLALGDAKAASAVVKGAGLYLVTALDSLTTELAVTSAWTLGNLAGSGPKACELLTAQGAITKLIELLDSTGTSEELREAVLYAAARLAQQLKNELRLDHLQKLFDILPHLDISATSQILFILSCHKDFTENLVSMELLSKTLSYLTGNMLQLNNENVTFLFRFLANINCGQIYVYTLNYLLEYNMVAPVKQLSQSNESVLWFLGNAFVLCGDHNFFDRLK